MKTVQIDNCSSSMITLNTGACKDYVLSPLLSFLYNHGSAAKFRMNAIYKFADVTTVDRKKLQKVVCAAQTITEANLPSMDSIYTARCRRKVANIKDLSHPSNALLQPILS
eukprot:g41698.t1